jgi:hypothetical protein
MVPAAGILGALKAVILDLCSSAVVDRQSYPSGTLARVLVGQECKQSLDRYE